MLKGLCCLPPSRFLLDKPETPGIRHHWPLHDGQCLLHVCKSGTGFWVQVVLHAPTRWGPVDPLLGAASRWRCSEYSVGVLCGGQGGLLIWMEMTMDRLITQHFILEPHFQFYPLEWPSSQGQTEAYSTETLHHLLHNHLQADWSMTASLDVTPGDDVCSLSGNTEEGVTVEGGFWPDPASAKSAAAFIQCRRYRKRLWWVFCVVPKKVTN